MTAAQIIVLVLGQVAIMGLTCYGLIRLHTNQQRRHSRHEDMLLDRLAHATGRTWTPPPADTGDQDLEPVYSGYDPFHEPDQ